jgi:hypothetical protein
MPTDLLFYRVQSINHGGTVIVFGESKGGSREPKDSKHKLWYKVLDLEQVADADKPNAWDDNTRWTDWMEVPYPDDLRCVGMSMLTVAQKLTDDMQTAPGRWQAVSDGSNIYLFRAIDVAAAKGWTASPMLLTRSPAGGSGAEPETTAEATGVDAGGSTGDNGKREAEATNIRVYANRYSLLRDVSPAGGTNRGASGKEITVPQLKPVYEARYRRSGTRETPQSDIDGQGYLDMGDQPFIEPTMEFSMVTPVDGLFTVTLAPSAVPGRKRWQFLWKEADKKLAALSLLRDEDGWVDLEEKSDAFNWTDAPYHLTPDRIFEISHSDQGVLELVGRPDCIMFRRQEESTGLVGDKEQMVSPERVLLAARCMAGGDERLVVVDFDLDDDGIAVIPETVNIDTVDFARTALHLNGETDQVIMPASVPEIEGSMTFQAWVRHNEGEGTLVERYDPETQQGFAIEWDTDLKKLVAPLALGTADGNGTSTLTVEAPMPTSHTWHHIALVVVDGGKASLYIDGRQAGESDKLVTAETFSVKTGEMIIGGRSAGVPERNWLDFEIDQVVLWNAARPPSINAIYWELNETELADPALLGCWQMDDAHEGSPDETCDSSPYRNHARIEGADHINQTAPIFRLTMGENFEDTLGDLSMGMGLVEIKDKELVDDPQLLLGSDGLIHLYTTARSEDAEGKLGDPMPMALQYDTTVTRAQFRFTWTAAVEGIALEEGELLLTARTAGPTMNRTTVELQKDGTDKLKLMIKNEHIGVTESWAELPRGAADLIAILNGEASADATEEAVQKGEKIYYAYDKNALYNEEPLSGVTGEDGKPRAVPSPTMMAFGVVSPQNGAEAQLVPQTAIMRQQANFGGWIHAPVTVSGQFGLRDGQPVAATVDLSQDRLMALSQPGDFALEAWVRPDLIPFDELTGDGESRIINLKGESETARYTMGLRRVSWSPALAASKRYTAKVTGTAEPLLTDGVNNGSFTVKARLYPPSGREQVGSLFQLISEDRRHMFYAEVDVDGVWFKFIEWIGRVTLKATDKDGVPDKIDQDDWRAATATASMTMRTGGTDKIVVDASGLVPKGRYTLWGIITEPEMKPAGGTPGNEFTADDNGNATVTITVPSDNNYKKLLIAYHSDGKTHGDVPGKMGTETFRQLTGDFPGPAGGLTKRTEDVFAPYIVGRDESVDVAFVWDIGNESRMKLVVNDIELASVEVERAHYGQIKFFNLGAPKLDDQRDEYWGPIRVQRNDLGPNFERGCGLTIEEVKVWNSARSEKEGAEIKLHWKLLDLKIEGDSAIVPNSGTMASALNLTIPKSELAPVYHLFAAAGERQVVSNTPIHPEFWSHVAAVCTGNRALRFNGDNQRAIIKDSGGLNVDKAFTIDCVVRWDGGTGTQYIFSRSETVTDNVAFQLGIRSGGGENGRPFLIFHMTDSAGNLQKQEVVHAQDIQKGVSYHLIARCALQDFMYEKNPADSMTERTQLWRLEARIWILNLDTGEWLGGQAPQDTEITREVMQQAIDFAAVSEAAFAQSVALQKQPLDWYWFSYQAYYRRLREIVEQRIAEREIQRQSYNLFYFLSPKNITNSKIGLRSSEAIASIGSLNGEGVTADIVGQGWFKGLIGNLRFWTQRLDAAALKRLAETAGLPADVPKPAAHWPFDENRGLQANDAVGGMAATLSDETMWTTTRLTSQLSLYINGLAASVRYGGGTVEYGDRMQLTFGALRTNDGLTRPFRGQLDEIRIWGDLRTQEEVYDNRHVLLGGNEDDLAGYWPIVTASGTLLKDASGYGNHAQLNVEVDHFWKRPVPLEKGYPAPIGNELPQVRCLLDGPETSLTNIRASSCGAVEYGETQTSPEGHLQAVMKRCQVLLDAGGRCLTFTGFKVGDLDLHYIGQVQSAPTLIGYIEGAPPVPSENATRAYYTSPAMYTAYDSAASVKLVEAENTVQIYSAESNRGFNQNWDLGSGLGYKTKFENGTALGAFFSTTTLDFECFILGRLSIENNYDYLSGGGAEIETARTLTNKIGTVGDWEKPNEVLNPDLGRRYKFANVGYALVRSGVANMYSMRMRKTGTLMGITLMPDPDIKEDYNVIMFELNPTYTKQGSLDGKIGFKNDPDFPAADQERGSYFNPKEVNNLVKQIEAHEARIAANYAQFRAGELGRREKGTHFQEDDPAQNAQTLVPRNIEMPYDWEKQVSKRNIVNTYVWTADGGLFVERQETSIVREESLGGAYAFKGMGGISIEGSIVAGGGVKWDHKVLLGGHIETKVIKTQKEGRNFGVDVELNVDGYLRKYTGQSTQYYGAEDVPGKVRSYRFKTFYLVPDKKHFQTFWDKVVSRTWLDSNDPNAQALRTARGNLNPVWRVMHRVTYVSRVPPKKDTVFSTSEKPTRAVIHQVPNREIIWLVLDVMRQGITATDQNIAGLSERERIGAAVADVIDNQWALSVPWWQGYMDVANAEPGGRLSTELKGVKQAVYEYMLAYFETGAAADDNRLKPVTVWEMTVKSQRGRRIIGGSFPRAGIKLTITGLSGKRIQVISGSRLEYGPGGFEVALPAPQAGSGLQPYTLTFLDQTFHVNIGPEQTIIVTFKEKRALGPGPERTLGARSIPVLGKWNSFAKLARSSQKISRGQ